MSSSKELAALVNRTLKEAQLITGTDKSLEVEYIPTGVLPIDVLTGGGMPRGRFIEIYGANSSLKSFIGLNTIAQAQKAGIICALFDTEHAFNPDWASSIGVYNDDLLVWPPRSEASKIDATGEQAIDTAEILIRNGAGVVVFDSIAALLPQTEHAKRLSDEKTQPGRLADLMSRASRKLTAANRDTAVIWINQTRSTINTFGSSTTTTGGKAMGFYASTRIQVVQIGKITEPIEMWDGDKMQKATEIRGQKFKATLEKSRFDRPHQEVYFNWYFDSGVDEIGFLISQGLYRGLISRNKVKWSYADLATSGGKDAFRTLLSSSPDHIESLKASVLAHEQALNASDGQS